MTLLVVNLKVVKYPKETTNLNELSLSRDGIP